MANIYGALCLNTLFTLLFLLTYWILKSLEQPSKAYIILILKRHAYQHTASKWQSHYGDPGFGFQGPHPRVRSLPTTLFAFLGTFLACPVCPCEVRMIYFSPVNQCGRPPRPTWQRAWGMQTLGIPPPNPSNQTQWKGEGATNIF